MEGIDVFAKSESTKREELFTFSQELQKQSVSAPKSKFKYKHRSTTPQFLGFFKD
jgi:hypothetical protein